MFMIINVPKFIIRKGSSYYVGGVAVWSGIRANAMTFSEFDVMRAKAIMYGSDGIAVEQV